MVEKEENKFWVKSNPIAWGVSITGLFAIFILVLGFQNNCTAIENTRHCSNKFQQFWNSPPNEIGDTFAGIAGALAFLWIIVTVLLQSQELKAQREELKQQRIEFKRMAEAQGAQVDLLSKQGEIFEKEQLDRTYQDLEKLFNSHLRYFLHSITGWKIENHYVYGDQFEYEQEKSVDINFMTFASILNKISTDNSPGEEVDPMQIYSPKNLAWQIDELWSIILLKERLSESQTFRFNMLGLEKIHQKLLAFETYLEEHKS